MKIVVFTITCNRLELTKSYLTELVNNSGYDFEHFIIDNGSTDGTLEWLSKMGYEVLSLKTNVGIIKAMKIAIKHALKKQPDLIIKFDNDCKIHSKDVLKSIVEFYKKGCKSCIAAPLDTAILEIQRPKSFAKVKERGFNLDYTTHVGGIFKVMPTRAAQLLLNESDSKVGGDLLRGRFWKTKGFDSIYITDLLIEHKGIGKQTKNYKLK